MELNIKDNGLTIFPMAKVHLTNQMAIFTKVNGSKVKCTAMVYLSSMRKMDKNLEINMKDNGKMVKKMDKALNNGLMGLSLKEIM
jgi:hypothetical protein